MALMAMAASATYAQHGHDMTAFSSSELSGTARYVGMGGAMGALGGDISTMSTNPAGIGIFRSSALAGTFSWLNHSNKSDYYMDGLGVGTTTQKEKKSRMSFDQMGFVYSNHISNEGTLRYFNIGFNYQKRRNLNGVFASSGLLGGVSASAQMAKQAYNAGLTDKAKMDAAHDAANPYNSTNYPYLSLLAVRTELVGASAKTGLPEGLNGYDYAYFRTEKGGVYEYDVNLSFNLNDRVYLGVTVGAYDIDYRRSTMYTEQVYGGELFGNYYAHQGYYNLYNDYYVEGSGVDLKIGAIFRPIEESPFRFGVAVHTPTFYNMREVYGSTMYTNIAFGSTAAAQAQATPQEDTTYDGWGRGREREYQLTTPWRFNLSAGTTLADVVAVGAEYEYTDYSTAKLEYDDGTSMTWQNDHTKSNMKASHTLKLGVEGRLSNEFAIRAGYNLTTALAKKTAYREFDGNDMRTDPEFFNQLDRNTFTVGLGYSYKRFFADVAYKFDTTKSEFYAFSNSDLPTTKVTSNRHQVFCTLGVRF